MIDGAQIKEHMDVKSSDDHHVGRVDHVRGTEIELAKLDIETKFKHRMIPLSWVDYVDEHVHLNLTREAAEAQWTEKH